MKKTTTLILAALVALAGMSYSPAVSAQSRTSGKTTVKKSRTETRRTTTRRTTTRHHRPTRHHHSTHHRSGVHVHVDWGLGPTYRSHRHTRTYHYPRYYHYPYVHRHTVVYEREPEVIVVEAEPAFRMPDLECPIRTDEVRSGLQQWCATSRGTKHGLYRRWYEDGVLAAEGEYEYDVQVGIWTEFHQNGAIREEGAYKDGARVGTWITWGSDGEQLVVVDY